MSEIGDNLRTLRTRLGWSQEKLAEAAGISQTTIDKIEQGTTLRSRFLGDIADALGVPLSEIDPSFKKREEIFKNSSFVTEQISQTEMPLYIARGSMDFGFLYLSAEPIDKTSRPRILDGNKNAYGVYMPVPYMAPELEPGDVALFDDRYPVISGTTGIFLNEYDDKHLRVIGRMVGMTDDEWVVRCWGLESDLKLKMKEWTSAHRMVGKYSKR